MIPFRPLEKVLNIIQSSFGLDIMYAYDDLVFAEHGIFLIQFDDSNENNLNCYLNQDFDLENYQDPMKAMETESKTHGFSLIIKGRFSMEQSGEDVKINLMTQKES